MYLDAVIFSHPWNHGSLELIEKVRTHYRIPAIIDVDDLVSDLPVDHPDAASFANNQLSRVVQAASHCVYSTEYLKLKLMHLNRNITVIPNAIDSRIYKNYQPLPKPYKNHFIVGWTGGQSHRADQYQTFLPGLDQFLYERPDARAYFHGLVPDPLIKKFGSQIIFDQHYVDFLDYPAKASTYPFDVCLVGLSDNNFNNAKSDLKLLEMAPNKIPVIASPRHDFIKHRDRNVMMYAEDGNSVRWDSWYEKLVYAYEHQDLMRELGQKAYDYVMSERTSDKTAVMWDEVLTKYIV